MPVGAACTRLACRRATNAGRSASSFAVDDGVGSVGAAMYDVRRSRKRSFALAGATRAAASQSRFAAIAVSPVESAPQTMSSSTPSSGAPVSSTLIT